MTSLVSSDQDGEGGRGKDGLHYTLRSVLLRLHAFRLEKCGRHFSEDDAEGFRGTNGRNAEAYVDDIIVKTREEQTLVDDLEETFANLQKVNIKLNPAKYAFDVPSGKLLGFLVSHRGIEANPDKVKAIEEMCPP
jgi:hypothetical protein